MENEALRCGHIHMKHTQQRFLKSRVLNHFRLEVALVTLEVPRGKCQLLGFHLVFDYGKIIELFCCFKRLKKTITG